MATDVIYDDVLKADLEDKGLGILRDCGELVVDTQHDAGRYNSALWFVMAHGRGDEGLRYDYDAETGIVTVYAP